MAAKYIARRRIYPKRRPRNLGRFPAPLPDLNVMVEYKRPDGRTYQRLMGGAAYRKLVGNAKGGQTTAARGTAHKWTSETARKAANKLWRTRMRKVNGIRIGVPAKRRARTDRKALREQYAGGPYTYHAHDAVNYDGIYYHFASAGWYVREEGGDRSIGEVTALRKLGHLPSPYRPIPHKVLIRLKLINGKVVAFPEKS